MKQHILIKFFLISLMAMVSTFGAWTGIDSANVKFKLKLRNKGSNHIPFIRSADSLLDTTGVHYDPSTHYTYFPSYVLFDSGTSVIIANNTFDSSNRSIMLSAGYPPSENQGAWLFLSGNEHASNGNFNASTGNDIGAKFIFYTTAGFTFEWDRDANNGNEFKFRPRPGGGTYFGDLDSSGRSIFHTNYGSGYGLEAWKDTMKFTNVVVVMDSTSSYRLGPLYDSAGIVWVKKDQAVIALTDTGCDTSQWGESRLSFKNLGTTPYTRSTWGDIWSSGTRLVLKRKGPDCDSLNDFFMASYHDSATDYIKYFNFNEKNGVLTLNHSIDDDDRTWSPVQIGNGGLNLINDPNIGTTGQRLKLISDTLDINYDLSLRYLYHLENDPAYPLFSWTRFNGIDNYLTVSGFNGGAGAAGIDLLAFDTTTDESLNWFIGIGGPTNNNSLFFNWGRKSSNFNTFTDLTTHAKIDTTGRFYIKYLSLIGSDTSQIENDGAPGRKALLLHARTSCHISGDGAGIHLYADADPVMPGGMEFYTNEVSRINVLQNGNVGIGVVAPSRTLHVENDIGINSANGHAVIRSQTTGGGSELIIRADSVNALGSGINMSDNDATFPGGIRFYTKAKNRLQIDSSGVIDSIGRLRVDSVWHAYGGFQDSSVTISIGSALDWQPIRNTAGTLWSGLEANGLTLSSDTMIFVNGADYIGSVSVTLSGLNGKDFKIRLYNITQAAQMGYMIGGTTNGATNYLPINLPLYIEANSGDKMVMQTTCVTDGSDPTIRSAVFYLTYLHD